MPPINQSNGYENVLKREDKLQENLKLLDITTNSKRRKLSRQRRKKKSKNVEAEVSSKVKKAEMSEKAPSARRISGGITKSFLGPLHMSPVDRAGPVSEISPYL